MYINYININIYFSPVQCVLQWDISSTWGSTRTEIQVQSVYVTLKNFLKLYRSINLNVTSFYLSCLLQFSLHSQFSCLFSYNITEAAWNVCFMLTTHFVYSCFWLQFMKSCQFMQEYFWSTTVWWVLSLQSPSWWQTGDLKTTSESLIML